MLPSALVPRVIYGLRTDVKHNTHYLNDSEILYAAGGVLVFQNLNTQAQKYLAPPEGTHLVTLKVSPNRNLIAALVQDGIESTIYIYDAFTLKKKRSLTVPSEATTKTIVSFYFSYDEKFVMMITGDPDWMMLAYNWERGKIETSTKANLLTNPLAPVKEIVCSPVDSSIIVIYGEGIFRLMNMQETVWRQYGFQKSENFDITSCCFLGGDRVVCGTADGLFLLIELAELKFILEAESMTEINARPDKEEDVIGAVASSMVLVRAKALEEEPKRERAIRALTPLNNGFAFACDNVVHFFEKISLHQYKKRNMYKINDKDFRENQTININTIMHLAVNKSETKMIATTRRSQIYEVDLWGPTTDEVTVTPFNIVWYSFHTGKIGALALCLWKPIFMTCGIIDRTVRVWNYATKTVELVKQYQEDVYSVSLHPTGLYAAIGFPDKLRFMVVLIDDLQVSKELPIRECPKSEFNSGGFLLAAVNRNVIQVFNIITFKNVANLKGHSNAITGLEWTKDDKKLISCGKDGAIYEWDMNTFKRIGEIVHKGLSYWGCAVMANGKNIFAVGSDNLLKEFRASNIATLGNLPGVIKTHSNFQVLKTINLKKIGINQVVVSRSNLMMFTGDTKGWIMMIKMPIEEVPEYETYHIHETKILHMKLSLDDRTLISCSDIGTVCIWSLENVEEKAIALDPDFHYFNEILISKSDLEEKISSIKDLTQRIYELEMEHAYQMSHIHTIYDEKIKDIHATYSEAVEELKAALELLEADYNTELNNISIDLNIIKKRHEADMLELERKYNADVIVEYNKVVDLEIAKEKVTRDFEAKLSMLQASKEKTIEELTIINESKLYNLNKMVEEARKEIGKEVAEHEELTGQIEDSNDLEIENCKAKYEKMLKVARESNMRLKGETGVLKKKIISCEKEKDIIQMEMYNVTNDLDKVKHTVRALEQEIQDLKKEVGERDSRIQEKERRLYDLKRKDQEYERYKFVLNYRIKELKNQIEPMDKEIKEKKDSIAEMEVGLYELQKTNLNLDNNLAIMREKLNTVYKSLHSFRIKCNEITSELKNVKTSIYAASGISHDFKKLKDSVKKLYFRYITDKDFGKSLKSDADCTAELERQKNYLEEMANNLGRTLEENKRIYSGEESLGQGKIYIERNLNLMDEINKIWKKLRKAQNKIAELETIICVKLTKIYSPRKAHNIIQQALKDPKEIKEECQIQVEEVTTKAELMQQELDSLLQRINILENHLTYGDNNQKKKRPKETLKFDIPSII